MVLKSVDAFSLAKVMGTLYAVLGFLFGLLFALLSLVGAGLADSGAGGLVALMFGVGGVIILPIIYGIIGFIAGLVVSTLYNIIAGMVGGVPSLEVANYVMPGASGGGVYWNGYHVGNNWYRTYDSDPNSGAILRSYTVVALNSAEVAAPLSAQVEGGRMNVDRQAES